MYGQQIGQRLKQSDFAALRGLKTERYGAYERGDGEPPLEVLATLRRVTGVSLDKLIGNGDASTNGRSSSIMLATPVRPMPKV